MTGYPKTEADAVAALEALYAQLPTVDCQGLCWNACGPISLSRVERSRVEAAGVDIPVFTHERAEAWARDEPLHCPALTTYKKCSVYQVRPLICRVYGVGRGELACRFGCIVTGGPRLRHAEVLQLIMASYRIGGYDLDMSADDVDERVLADPGVLELMGRWMNGERWLRPQLEAAFQAARERLEREMEQPPAPG